MEAYQVEGGEVAEKTTGAKGMGSGLKLVGCTVRHNSGISSREGRIQSLGEVKKVLEEWG